MRAVLSIIYMTLQKTFDSEGPARNSVSSALEIASECVRGKLLKGEMKIETTEEAGHELP